jgi:hypothetical protein
MRPSVLQRLALNIFALPFLVGGIVAAFRIAAWIATSFGESVNSWFCVSIALLLMPFGVAAGALLAYGVLVLALRWISPNHALLAQTEKTEATGVAVRLIAPAFEVVRTFVFWLTARR